MTAIIDEKRRNRVVVHEAAHAVAAIRLGVAFDEVAVFDEVLFGSSARHLRLSNQQRNRAPLYEGRTDTISALKYSAERDAMISFAGSIGEGLLLNSDLTGANREDEAVATEALRRAYGFEVNLRRIVTTLRKKTADLLRRDLKAIESVSEALEKRRRLSYNETRAITRRCFRLPR